MSKQNQKKSDAYKRITEELQETFDGEEKLRRKYPIDTLEKHFTNIEKLGYTVNMTNDCCQIWDGTKLIIDADMYSDFHTNAASMIEAFFYE